jgi:hypothetical protein
MARICLTTTAVKTEWSPYALSNYNRVLRAAQSDSIRQHSLTEFASEADCVLFVESRCRFHTDVMASMVYKEHKSKCLIFDLQDNTIPRIPGIYMGIPSHLHSFPIYEYGFYTRVFDNRVISDGLSFSQGEYLFSFIGSSSNCPSVRKRILRLKHGDCLLEDCSSGQSDLDKRYAELLSRSKFVLCPRGVGASTWRMFETMRAGRVPVIVSDEWCPPKGLNWEEFSIRIIEKDIDQIPDILESLKFRAQDMGTKARHAWEANFGLKTSFHWIAEACMRIQQVRDRYRHVERRSVLGESLRPLYGKDFYKEMLRELPRRTGTYKWIQRAILGLR